MEKQIYRDAITLRTALKKLVRLYQFRDRNKLLSTTNDLSVNQFYIIELIIENRIIGIIDLAEKLFLNKSTISRIVDHLVSKGLIIKEDNPKDGRAIKLIPTEKGIKKYEEISNSEISRFENYLKEINPLIRVEINKLILQIVNDAEAIFLE